MVMAGCKPDALLLFDLSSSSDLLQPLHKLVNIELRRMTAVTEAKIAVLPLTTNTIEFYTIYQQKIIKSDEDNDINIDGKPWDIDFGDQTFFVVTSHPDAVLHVDLKGTVLNFYAVPLYMEHAHIFYDSNAAMMYISNRTRAFKMTLTGEVLTIIRKIPEISYLTVTENEDLLMACSKGLFLVNIDTGHAFKWKNNGKCVPYQDRQYKLYVHYDNKVHIFETGK